MVAQCNGVTTITAWAAVLRNQENNALQTHSSTSATCWEEATDTVKHILRELVVQAVHQGLIPIQDWLTHILPCTML